MKRWMSLPLAVVLLWPMAAVAQEGEEPASPGWWAVFSEMVEPAMVDEFEASSAEMMEIIRANAPEGMTYYTLSGPKVGYMYAVPLESYEDLMQVGAKWEGMVDKVGRDKWMEMDAKGAKAVSNRSMALYVERLDLSYQPDSPRLTPEEAPMRHYDYVYPVPGKEQALEALMREWIELYRSNGADSGWMVYQAFTGEDLPLYVLSTLAMNRGDYEADGERLDEMFGEADDELWLKTRALMRKFDHTDAWMRPELSLMPDDM